MYLKQKNILTFLAIAIVSIGVFFISISQAQAMAILNQTFPANVTSSTINGTARQLRVDPSDGKAYVLGTSITTLGAISADGSSFSAITYTPSLPTYTSGDFVIVNNQAFITISGAGSPGVYRYDISGSTGNFIASTTLSLGTTAATLGNGVVYISKGTSLVTYDTNLIKITSTTLPSIPIKISYANGKLFYVSATGRIAWNDLVSVDTVIANIGGSNVVKSLVASNDGSAIYFASSTALKKISADTGTSKWSVPISILAMDVNTNTGKITVVNGAGDVSLYDPINPVSNFTITPSSDSAVLNWTTGVSDSDFSGVTIRRSTISYPTSATDGTAVTSSDTGTDFTDTGLTDGTYYYSIFNRTADGYYSSAATSTVTIDATPPNAPILSAFTTNATINLTWDVPIDTVSFILRRSTSGFPSSISDGTAVTTTDSTITALSQAGMSDGSYYYSIFAGDVSGNYSAAGTASASIDTLAPSAPTNFTATANNNTINLTWDNPPDSDFSSSIIRRSTISAPTSITDGTAVTSTSQTTYSDTDLTDGTYYYSIFASDATGNFSIQATTNATINTSRPTSGGGQYITPPFLINNNLTGFTISESSDGSVSSSTITLNLNANPMTVRSFTMSLDSSFTNARTLLFNQNKKIVFTLPNKTGIYTIYIKYDSITGDSSPIFSQTVTYTSTPPTGVSTRTTISLNSIPVLFKQTLVPNNKNNDVKLLQKFLNEHGFLVTQSGPGSPGKETINFGPATTRALIKFQEANAKYILQPLGLTKGTGILGNATIKFINIMTSQ